jgi:hypothetical protein
MGQFYSNAARESDPHALPDCEAFELTAEEIAASSAYEDEQYEFMRRHEFRLATMNTRVREEMIAAMISELGITGGWYYHYCRPGCLPDSDPFGPFESRDAAIADARENAPDDASDGHACVSTPTPDGHGAYCRICGETLA